MKHLLLSAVVAGVISVAVVTGLNRDLPPATDAVNTSSPPPTSAEPAAARPAPATASATPGAGGGLSLRFTDALVEDVWIDAARTAGDDHRSLTDADNSICFITKIEISGIQSPDDTSSCAMQIDDFTGFWDLVATVEEGGQSEIRCNARCLVWEQE